MAIKISIISTKGGVGKTTFAANLGAILADPKIYNKKVLLIDCDQQQSLSKYYPLDLAAKFGLKEFVQSMQAIDCITKISQYHLDLIYNDDPHNTLREWMRLSSSNAHYLASALSKLEDQYDFIIMDTKGSAGLGDIQEMAIRSSDRIISPLVPDWMSAKELTNTLMTLLTLEPPPGIRFDREIPALEAIIYKFKRTSDNETVLKLFDEGGDFQQEYLRISRNKFKILKTIVPDVEAYNKATGESKPIHIYETRRKGPTFAGLETMRALVNELFPEIALEVK